MARIGMFPGVGNQPFEVWDAWYGPFSAGVAVPPTAMANAMELGMIVGSHDPYWGYAEFILCQYQTASSAVATGTLVQWDNNYILSPAAATANTGRPLGFLSTQILSDATLGALTAPWNQIQTTNQVYAWVQISGLAPAIGITGTALTATQVNLSATAGEIQSAHVAGQQVLNAFITVGSGTAWSRYGATTIPNASSIVGRSEIFVNDRTGLFPGMPVSGPNIPASSYITDMQTGRNNSILINATATISGPFTLTPLYNIGTTTSVWGLVQCNRPFLQGSIT